MGTGPGQIADDTDFSKIKDSTYSRPTGRITNTATQALADATDVALTWNTDDIDTHDFHNPSSNPTRITPNKAGQYLFIGTAFYDSQATPVATQTRWRKNGVTNLYPASRSTGFTQSFEQTCSIIIEMNGSTDYLELVARQDSAGADTTSASTQLSSAVQWMFVRDL